MKKMVIALFGFFVVVVVLLWLSTGEDVKHNQPVKLGVEKKIEKSQAVPVLDEINARNENIRNFDCDNLRVIAQMPGKRPARIHGYLSYEKERKFRLELSSLLGSELDIGSDGNVFWFWSRRIKEPGLYWAYHKDFNKTRLKTPFNPFWLSHCLGIDKIDYKDAVIDSTGSKWRVIKNTINAKNEPVTAVIYIDPKRKLITGHGMYERDGTLAASSEIEAFEKNGMPSKMTFMWYKEDASMVWTLNNTRLNVGINPSRWEMPNRTPKIDMSRE